METLVLTTWSDVDEPDFVGEGSDEVVAAGGEVGGHSGQVGRKDGDDEHPSGGQWGFPLWRDSLGHATGRTDDDRRSSSKENAQAFLFHRRMESPDDAAPGVAPTGDLIVSPEDCAAGASGGAEESGFWCREQV